MPFINRTTELADLEKRWKSGKSECFIVYGKRRVGKTELVKHFIQGKHAVYFLADKRAIIDQLREVARLIGEAFHDESITRQGFDSWLDVFVYLKRNVHDRFILAVDEFPYLTEVDPAMSSIFQKGWDEYLHGTNIMFVLLGSSIAMMESQVLLEKAPLFGRRTGQQLLQPLTFAQSRKFFPNTSFRDALDIYTVTGGMPAYLMQMEEDRTLEENIKQHIFPTTEFLHNEIEFILKEELREPKHYLSILRAIALNKRKLSEIVNETGLPKPKVNVYLQTLAHLHITERELPVTEANPEKSRKGLYRLRDNFFRFWFQYVFPYKSDLEIRRYDEVLRRFQEQFQLLVSKVYEEVCREFVREFPKPFSVERVGNWWEKNEELDIVALSVRENSILFGECKWSEKQVGTNIYLELQRKASLVQWGKPGRKEYFLLCSKSGFTPDMLALAKQEHVLLMQEGTLLEH